MSFYTIRSSKTAWIYRFDQWDGGLEDLDDAFEAVTGEFERIRHLSKPVLKASAALVR